MKILFVHQNFPGQFPHLSAALAARGHKVLALTDQANRRPAPKGVTVMRYRTPQAADDSLPGHLRFHGRAVARGLSVARAGLVLRDRHAFTPDVIVGHPGWGETLFLRDIWPGARLIVYAEFFYASHGLDTDFDAEFQTDTPERRFGVTVRQALWAQAMAQADAAISPTEWQAATFPPAFRPLITVAHDGIDTDRVAPDPAASLTLTPPDGPPVTLRAGDEVLSFVNRNIEPYRGAHIFLRALPAVLAARPAARVVVLGGDGISYGSPPPGGGGWRAHLLAELGDRLDLSRVHFPGRLPYADFVRLLQVTRVHAYLTYPFVLSWSLLEAMAAGAHVIGSDTPPLREVLADGVTGDLVGFFDVPGWSAALIAALADPRRYDDRRRAARALIRERFDLRRTCLPRLVALVEDGRRA